MQLRQGLIVVILVVWSLLVEFITSAASKLLCNGGVTAERIKSFLVTKVRTESAAEVMFEQI